jgi:hypothetical protein
MWIEIQIQPDFVNKNQGSLRAKTLRRETILLSTREMGDITTAKKNGTDVPKFKRRLNNCLRLLFI